MTNIHEDFSRDIETAVQSILSASHRAAVAALDEAFKTKRAGQARRPRASADGLAAYSRRSREELGALSAKLYQVICSKPGETMAVIAREVGAAPHSLQVPVSRLKRAGRIRTVGERQFTRYFPLAGDDVDVD